MEIVDTNGAAERLRLSPRTLCNKRVDGSGPPFVRYGRAVRYRLVDLDAWLASRVVTSTSQAVAA